MILKQLALTEQENDILHELVAGEIKTGMVYGQDRDMIEIMRVLMGLYDQLENFTPPKRLNAKQTQKETKPNRSYRSTRQPSEGDLQAGE